MQQPTPVCSTVPVQQPTPVFSTVPVRQPTPVWTTASTVPVRQPTPVCSTVPVQQPAPVCTAGSTVPVQQPTPVCSTVPIQSNGILMGTTVHGLTDILQWTFPVNFCQSTLGGRSGSNACTFIALYFGHLYHRSNLSPPLYGALSTLWKSSLYKAMVEGNKIHDELFEGEGVDVAVQDAVETAGAECFVQALGQSYDLFGIDCADQLAAVFETLSTSYNPQPICNVIVTRGRSFSFIANQDGSCMIVDSHRHGTRGAIIAYCPPKCAKMLAKWLEALLQQEWQCNLRFCSITPIFYVRQ